MRTKLFVMSLTMMWLFIFIKSYEFPFYIGKDIEFIGGRELLNQALRLPNMVCIVSGLLLFLAAYFFAELLYSRSENKALDLGTKVTRVANLSQEYLSYISTIFTLISAMVANYESLRDVILLCILVVFLYFTISKSSWYYSNPLFAVWGFNVYRIEEESRETDAEPYLEGKHLLIKGKLTNNDLVKTLYITEGLLFGVVSKKE